MKPNKQNIMEAIYLQSMTDFVLERFKFWQNDDNPDCQSSARYILGTNAYAKFLIQPLQLGMFVPCDENGNVLDPSDAFRSCEKGFVYSKAKERVLFKGFEHYLFMQANNVKHNKSRKCFSFPNYNGVIIEDLISLEVELTESAIKQIGL